MLYIAVKNQSIVRGPCGWYTDEWGKEMKLRNTKHIIELIFANIFILFVLFLIIVTSVMAVITNFDGFYFDNIFSLLFITLLAIWGLISFVPSLIHYLKSDYIINEEYIAVHKKGVEVERHYHNDLKEIHIVNHPLRSSKRYTKYFSFRYNDKSEITFDYSKENLETLKKYYSYIKPYAQNIF